MRLLAVEHELFAIKEFIWLITNQGEELRNLSEERRNKWISVIGATSEYCGSRVLGGISVAGYSEV